MEMWIDIFSFMSLVIYRNIIYRQNDATAVDSTNMRQVR